MAPPNPASKRLFTGSVPVRLVSWVAIPLFLILYLLGIFWLMSSPDLWPAAQPFADFAIQQPSVIRMVTAVMSALFALFFFWPWSGRRLVGRWANYIGLAFI